MISKILNQKYKILSISSLILLDVLIYSNTFYNPFYFDDVFYVNDNFAIRNIGNLKAIWSSFPSRFVTFFTFALNYNFNALDVFSYHLFNLIIHLLSAVLVFWLATLILSTPAMQKNKILFVSRPVALFVSLIFLSHPLQTESVTYIWQRCTLLAAFFYLLALCLYFKSRLLQINSESSAKVKIFYILSLFSAVISMFSKENSATLPLMIILCEFYFLKTSKHIKWKCVIPFLVLLPIVPAVLFFAKPETFGDVERLLYAPAATGWHYFITQLRVIITYLRLVFIPVNQNLDYDYPVMKSIFQPQVFLSFIALSLILFAAFKLYKKYKLTSFAILWFFIALLPESSIIPLKDIIFEHRLYLPIAGFSIFLVSSLYYLFQPKKIGLFFVALSVITAAYSFMAYQRNKVWKNEIILWTDTISKSPNKARPYNNRGAAYLKQGNINQAIADFDKAIQINPDYAEAYRDRGVAYYSKDSFDEAIVNFIKALQISPNYADAYSNRGVVYVKQGKFDQAIADFNKAIQIKPNCADAYSNRGVAYASKGNLDEAIADFSRVIQINPGSIDAYINRAVACINKGNINQAISDFSKVIQIDTDYAYAYYNRAVAYFYNKDYDKSWSDIYRAEKLGYKVAPDFIEELKKYSNSPNG